MSLAANLLSNPFRCKNPSPLSGGIHIAFKSNIDSQLRGFWFAPNGLDTNSGETLEVPKLTIQAAIDAADALVPPPSFNFSGFVTASQGGEFFDSFVVSDFISLDGNNCNLLVDAPIAVTMGSFGLFNMTAISNTQVNGVCVEAASNVRRAIDLLFMGIFGEGGMGMNISGTVEDFFSSTRLITIEGANGIGYNITSTSTNPIDIKVEVVSLMADGSTFINYNPVNATDRCAVDVSSVTENGFTTTAFTIDNGILVVEAAIVANTTFAVLNNNAQFTIRSQAIQGTLVLNDGSICIIKPVAFYVGNIDVNDTATLFMDAQVLRGNIDMAVNTDGIVDIGLMQGNLVNNGTLFIEVESLEGDITVASGATLNCDIASHTGTLTNNGTINGIINGVPFGTYRQKQQEQVVLNGFDTNNQVPVGTDNPLQITFGAAQFGPTDPLQLSAAGAITVNQSDQYNMLIVFQYGRTGAAGGSTVLFFRVLINGVQFGRSLYADLDNPNQAFPVEFTTPVDLLAADVLTVEIWRDSAGFDAGELIPKVPTLGGTNSSPSAAITLTRNRLVQPEIAP